MESTAVKERPILFSGPMVRAIFEGRKTQTRRVVKPQPVRGQVVNKGFDHRGVMTFSEGWHWDPSKHDHHIWRDDENQNEGDWAKWFLGMCPYELGARLCDGRSNWKPSIFMPRWASRLTLTVTDVRVERLQAISEADVIAEGIQKWPLGYRIALTGAPKHECLTFDVAADAYRWLWNSINGAGGWEANPWIVAVSFRAAQHNIDQLSRLTVSCTDAGSMRA